MHKFYLKTERLVLKAPSVDDLNDLKVLFTDQKVTHFLGGPRTPATIQDELELAIDHYHKYRFSLGNVYLKDGTFIGQAGLIYFDYNKSNHEIELSYALLPAYWGFGYGGELAKALIEYGFKQLHFRKIIATTRPENMRSKKILERLGFQFQKQFVYKGTQLDYFVIQPN